MRLVTYHDERGDHIGALRDGSTIVPLDTVAPSMLALIDGGAALLSEARATLERAASTVPLGQVRLLAPIPRPRQNVICLGMNYVEHAYESMRAKGLEPSLPPHPVFFSKAATSICADGDDIPLDPRVTEALDYEVELAFIIGQGGKNIARGQAMAHVFGYTIVNDISARDLQNRHQQFYKGKSLDRSCPIGPWIVTADEIADPAALGLRLRLNGATRQDSSVGDLIFDIPTTIEVLSLGQTLEPGTIISTGTPSGVGMGMSPPSYLRAGDVMEAEIDGIGVLRNRVVAAE
ncbi:MAG TPA: fumarylacetoacetate hydrolase family protein [Kouleothrix sp.]|uniref:fumarylacetoacetate hydrolase family protein n=1 Tax=Kouleothrix sp. TaxID=2779161 RepID=UPI002BFC729A|nr:fumarylacetoacetate hydrolase family protein [Kouleothrix sp.]